MSDSNQKSPQPLRQFEDKVERKDSLPQMGNPYEAVKESATKLKELHLGGFNIFEKLIKNENIKDLNPAYDSEEVLDAIEEFEPETKARLLQQLKLVYNLIDKAKDAFEAADNAKKEAKSAEQLLQENVANVLDKSHTLEISYEGMNLFF